ncbi:hypothetical protein JCM10212_000076 [Sporobolomyces blumeae]
MVNPRCFLDFQVEGQPLGRVIFELFADVVPKTVENFRALCTGSKGVNELGIPLYYKGCPVHRIIQNFMVQGGDFTLRNGKGGESIYGPGGFADEDLRREVDEEGLLVMANKGKNTNSSQFFVTLRPCPHLNGKHVVFGKVVKGYEIIQAMSKLPTDPKDRPLQLVTISHCGELERKVKAVPRRAPSPTPSSASGRSRSRSRSVSRSRSPSPARDDRHRHRSGRSRSHRDGSDDEDSDREKSSSRRKHKSSSGRRSKHRSSRRSRRDGDDADGRDRSRSRSPRRSRAGESKEEDGLLSPEEIAALERRAAEEAAEERRKRDEDEERRKEQEREAARKREQYEREMIAQGGVVFKGRGAMKAPGDGARRGGGMRGW